MRILLALVLTLAFPVGLRSQPNPSGRFDVPAMLAVTVLSAANTIVTATLPAVAGMFHYITSIHITRVCTTAVGGTAVLAFTTTNLPGALAYTAGNFCSVGQTFNDLVLDLTSPLKSSVVNTATTVVCPNAGVTVQCRISVLYFIAP